MDTAWITVGLQEGTPADWAEWIVRLLWLSGIPTGQFGFAVLSFAVGAIIAFFTAVGVRFGTSQFRIANTIKYLDEFRTSEFKRRIETMRADDLANGHYWRVYGLMGDVKQLTHAGVTISVPLNQPRIEFAINAKYISHYFDYAGILIHRDHIDADLFFEQLCEVVIDNWRVLQPYIYYQRLARFDRFARSQNAIFGQALSVIEADPAAPPETVNYLSQVVAALRSLDKLPDTAPRKSRSVLGVSSKADLTALDDQMWFELLYMKAKKWRDKRQRVANRYVSSDEIHEAVLRVGSKPAGTAP